MMRSQTTFSIKRFYHIFNCRYRPIVGFRNQYGFNTKNNQLNKENKNNFTYLLKNFLSHKTLNKAFFSDQKIVHQIKDVNQLVHQAKKKYEQAISQNASNIIDCAIIYAQTLCVSKQLDQALKLVNDILQKNKDLNEINLIKVYITLGVTYDLKKNFPQALIYLKKAEQLSKNPIQSYMINSSIGKIYQDQNNIQQSLKYYLKAYSFNQKNQDAFLKVAQCYFLMRDINKIDQLYKKGELNFPNNYQVLTVFGQIYIKLGRTKQGLQNLDRAIELNPQNMPSYRCKLEYLITQKKIEQSLEFYKFMNQKFPSVKNDKYIVYMIGIAFYEAKKYQQSINQLQKVTFDQNNFPVAQFVKGNCYMHMQKLQQAKIHFQKAIKLNLKISAAFVGLAGCWFSQGNKQKAIENYNKALQVEPNNSQTLQRLGVVYHDIGNYDYGAKYYQKSLEINPDNANCNMNLGHCYIRLGKFNEGLKCYDIYLNYFPNNLMVKQNKAFALINLGKFSQAKPLLQAVIKQIPIYENYFNLAVCYKMFYDLDKCEQCCKKAIQLSPTRQQAKKLLLEVQQLRKKQGNN